MLFRSLFTSSISTHHTNLVRFEKSWLSQEGFINLLIQWWNSYPLGLDISNSWRLKLQFLRRKLRGWCLNFLGEKKKNKQQLLEQISDLETLYDTNALTNSQYIEWQNYKSALHQIYRDEEAHWQQRAKLRWHLEGDLNTKFFHITATNRKKKNLILSLEIY